MSIKNNPNLLYAIIGIFLLAVVVFTFVGSDEEMVETPVDVEENIEIEIAEEPAIVEDKIKEFDLSIVDRKMTLDPPIISVEVGDQVLLNIISDEDLMFHIHEYDHEIMLMTDELKVLSFSAMFPGRFEIEIHTGKHEMEMGGMNMDVSNAEISIESVMVMDNMATVSVEIEGVEFPSKGIHWHVKLDEEIKGHDHSALMVFDEKSYTLKAIPKGEHTVYVSLVNAEHELIGNQASKTFTIETEMEPGMNMEEEHGHGEEEEAILIGFLEVMPRA